MEILTLQHWKMELMMRKMEKVIYLEMEDEITYYKLLNKREHYRKGLREQNIYVSYLEKEFLQHLQIPKTA